MDNDKYKGRFRNETTRLRSWDYAADAWYFVTICTHNRTHNFGEIANDAMRLSLIGKMAQKYWEEIRSHFVGIDLDEYVIMPNHMHGIIVINKQDATSTVGTRHGASLQPTTGNTPEEAANTFGPLKKNSLQAIINQYKGAVTRWCRKSGHAEFAWQPRYYDHVIRNEETLYKIREYIGNNPLKWSLDKENAAGAWM